jgi:hypothetical protein
LLKNRLLIPQNPHGYGCFWYVGRLRHGQSRTGLAGSWADSKFVWLSLTVD